MQEKLNVNKKWTFVAPMALSILLTIWHSHALGAEKTSLPSQDDVVDAWLKAFDGIELSGVGSYIVWSYEAQDKAANAETNGKGGVLSEKTNFEIHFQQPPMGYVKLHHTPRITSSHVDEGHTIYHESQQSYTFDGEKWVVAEEMFGKRDNVFPYRQAYIHAERPSALAKDFRHAGLQFLPIFIKDLRAPRGSMEYFDISQYDVSHDGDNIILMNELMHEEQVVKKEVFVLEDAIPFEVIRWERHIRKQDGKMYSRISTVEEFFDTDDDLAYALPKVALNVWRRGDELRFETRVQFDKMVMQEPRKKESFQYSFSPGWQVKDLRSGKTFTTGKDAESSNHELRDE